MGPLRSWDKSILALGPDFTEQGRMTTKPSSNRRDFLKRTTGAGLLICSPQVAFGYKANERLNVAAIGIGGMGEGNVNNVSSENLVAFCDVDERRSSRSRKRHPKVKVYQDFRLMLAEKEKEIDAVVVSTPDNTHAVAAITAMKMGKHVYCEKPLTRTVYEARMMRLTAQANKVVTQMGNQGSASEGVRRATEWGMAGTVGPVKEAYLWVGDGDGGTKSLPTDKPDVPKELNWDLWLGPATERAYHPSYLPFTWRGWRHFGSGGLGDMGCHTGNFLFRCLKLPELWALDADTPKESRLIKVEGEATGVHVEGYPSACRVHFHIPARGDLPPVKLTVSSGVPMRPAKELLHGEALGGFGALLVGSKGSIYSSNPWNTSSMLLPKNNSLEQPPKTIPRGVGHHREWINACKGQGKTFSPFDIGGPLTELIQLANVGGIAGEPFTFDPATGKITGSEKASALLHRPYRKGWSI